MNGTREGRGPRRFAGGPRGLPARALFLFGPLLALLFAGRAQAVELQLWDKPLKLTFTEYGAAAYHLDNGNVAPPGTFAYDPTGGGYTDWLNRLQADASWGDFTALLRLDSDLFFNAPQAAPGDTRIKTLLQNRFGNRLDLEKVAVGYTSRHLEVTLGDSYVTYGRGLVLALRKEDELGVDTTVRGAQAVAHLAGLNLNAVAGVSNIINVDTGTGREADDPNDLIVGTRAEYRFGKYVVPGVDAALVRYANNFSPRPQQDRDRDLSYSATLEFPYLGGYGNLYFEYARQAEHLQDHDVDPAPTAFYAAGTAYLGPATVLLEYKNYRHFSPVRSSLDPLKVPELALTDFYSAPPTLERVQQAIIDNSDVTGPHVRVDLAATPNLTPFVSMAVFQDRLYRLDIYDPYAGVEARWQDAKSRLSLSGGRELSRTDGGLHDGQLFEDTSHLEYDLNQWITGPYSAEIDGLHFAHHDRIGAGTRSWVEGQHYLSFKKAEAWSAAVGYEYYSEFPSTVRTHYFNASGSLYLAKDVLVRLFAGGQRAGIKCVNGVCRNYPAFDGFRAELLAKF